MVTFRYTSAMCRIDVSFRIETSTPSDMDSSTFGYRHSHSGIDTRS